MKRPAAKRALSLVELVVVIAILGIVAALIIPRMTRADVDSAGPVLRERLSVLRTAIELYYHDHGAYPGQRADGTSAGVAGAQAAFIAQLTRYTNADGRVSDKSGPTFCFGPYLQNGIPPCPLGAQAGLSGVYMVGDRFVPAFTADATDAGWIYNFQTGYIAVNADEVDGDNVRFDKY